MRGDLMSASAMVPATDVVVVPMSLRSRQMMISQNEMADTATTEIPQRRSSASAVQGRPVVGSHPLRHSPHRQGIVRKALICEPVTSFAGPSGRRRYWPCPPSQPRRRWNAHHHQRTAGFGRQCARRASPTSPLAAVFSPLFQP